MAVRVHQASVTPPIAPSPMNAAVPAMLPSRFHGSGELQTPGRPVRHRRRAPELPTPRRRCRVATETSDQRGTASGYSGMPSGNPRA